MPQKQGVTVSVRDGAMLISFKDKDWLKFKLSNTGLCARDVRGRLSSDFAKSIKISNITLCYKQLILECSSSLHKKLDLVVKLKHFLSN